MRANYKYLALLATVVVVAICLAFVPAHEGEEVVVESRGPSGDIASGPRVSQGNLPRPEVVKIARPPLPTGRADGLFKEILTSSSYKRVVDEAFQKRRRGAALYGRYIATQCTLIKNAIALQVSSHGTTSMAQVRDRLNARAHALEQYSQRCDLHLPELFERLHTNNAEWDPLFVLSNQLNANQAQTRRTALAQAFQTADPILLFESGALQYSNEQSQIFFNGERLRPEQLEPYRLALKLAACDLGAECGENDLWLQGRCIVRGECATYRQEYIDNYYSAEAPEWYMQIQNLRAQLVDAIKEKRVSAFVPN